MIGRGLKGMKQMFTLSQKWIWVVSLVWILTGCDGNSCPNPNPDYDPNEPDSEACLALCDASTYRCNQNNLERCKDDGSGWEFVSSCPSGKTCSGGTCIDGTSVTPQASGSQVSGSPTPAENRAAPTTETPFEYDEEPPEPAQGECWDTQLFLYWYECVMEGCGGCADQESLEACFTTSGCIDYGSDEYYSCSGCFDQVIKDGDFESPGETKNSLIDVCGGDEFSYLHSEPWGNPEDSCFLPPCGKPQSSGFMNCIGMACQGCSDNEAFMSCVNEYCAVELAYAECTDCVISNLNSMLSDAEKKWWNALPQSVDLCTDKYEQLGEGWSPENAGDGDPEKCGEDTFTDDF